MLAPGPHDGLDSRRLGDLFLLGSPRRLARVTGVTRWNEDAPAFNRPPASVRLRKPHGQDFEIHAATDPNGRFDLLAPEGEYEIRAMDTRILAEDAQAVAISLEEAGLAVTEPLFAPSPPQDLDRLLPSAMGEFGVRTAGIAWLKNGNVAYARNFGVQANGQAADENTRFRVASITKAVTTMVVLDLVRTGDWELDRPLADDWMDPDIADDPRSRLLTSRMVLRHLTGLPNWRQGDLSFIDDPGRAQHYSGEAFELLRKALEARLGKSLQDLASERIFDPAGMTATSYRWSETRADQFAGEFHASGAPVDHYRGNEINAAANLLSTPSDLLRFAQWTMGWGRENADLFSLLSRPNDSSLLAPGNEDWARHGLGWLVHDDDGELVLEHSGGQQGIRTQLVVIPERAEAFVVLTNSTAGWPLVRMAFDASVNRGGTLPKTSAHLFADLED